jgi:hypothetical protein
VGDGDRRRLLDRALNVAGTLVIAWGILLILTLGLTAGGIASGLVLAPYGVAIIEGNQRAVPLGWLVALLTGVAALVDGLPPVLVLVWSGFFALAMFLSDHRDYLRS